MEYKEMTAKTVDEAITKACLEMGITSDKLDYEVVTEGSNGFLGIGSKDAMIRYKEREVPQPGSEQEAAMKGEKTPVKEKAKDENKGSFVSAEDIEARAAAAALRDKELGITYPEPKERSERSDRGDRGGRGNGSRSRGGYSSNYGGGTYDKKNSGRKRDRRNDRGDRGEHSRFKEDREMEGRVIDVEKPHAPSVPKPERKVNPKTEEEVAAMKTAAENFLKNVFGTMDMHVDMSMEYDQTEGSLNCTFSGDDMGILIGKRGQTLDSLQYLTSLVINKGSNDYTRVKLDTEDYRKRRKETLENLSRNIAYKVKHTHKAVALEPMNPYERRIIHSALQDSEFVETYSEGEEPYRHVVVTTKKKQNSQDAE